MSIATGNGCVGTGMLCKSGPKTRPGTPKARGAFTLVELLVVIGIIAVLISILLPAMNSARRQANTVRCLSNMRQLGTAFMMYSNAYKGYWPVTVWRHEIREKNYWYENGTDNPATTAPRNWYWHMFIQQYLNSKAARNTGNTGSNLVMERGEVIGKNILWGCPNWRPWADASFTGGINLDETGYGMNWAPTYRADFPSPTNPDNAQTDGPQAGVTGTQAPQWCNRAYRQNWGIADTSSSRRPGRFFKQSEWRQPSERMLVADSEYFTPALDTPPGSNGLPSPQPIHQYQLYGAYNIDFFRHAKGNPKVIQASFGPAYEMSSMAPAVNVLFCDGRAETLRTYSDVYKSYRMRFPG